MANSGIVLVGPPGSGKTSIGLALGVRGYWFEDREAALVTQYGSIEEFRRQKTEAVARLHAGFLEAMRAEPRPWVYESTALTERDFVARLREAFGGFAVRLEVPVETTAGRIANREPGGNLTNDQALIRIQWQAFTDAYEGMSFDLSVATGGRSPKEVAAVIDGAFRSRGAATTQAAPRVMRLQGPRP
ncbi:MAG: hypothetical protein WED87_05380 [Dehalococcoidia bacterium]